MLSKTKDITVHTVFSIYNTLFAHFEKSITQLRRKKVPWKQSMLNALEAGQSKLSLYYSKTEQIHGSYYAIATILAPTHNLQFFPSKEWVDNSQHWHEIYRNTLQEYLEPYKQRLSDSQSSSVNHSSIAHTSELHSLLHRMSLEHEFPVRLMNFQGTWEVVCTVYIKPFFHIN